MLILSLNQVCINFHVMTENIGWSTVPATALYKLMMHNCNFSFQRVPCKKEEAVSKDFAKCARLFIHCSIRKLLGTVANYAFVYAFLIQYVCMKKREFYVYFTWQSAIYSCRRHHKDGITFMNKKRIYEKPLVHQTHSHIFFVFTFATHLTCDGERWQKSDEIFV